MVQKNSVKPKIIIIVGPTASGKTRMGVSLAKAINGEIISADSMQVYKGMDIGTAKVSEREMAGVRHHLLDVAKPSQNYSVSLWKSAAEDAIDDIISRGKVPIIVGGTGLYITSLIKGYTFFEAEENEKLRASYQRLTQESGAEALYNKLKEKNEKLAKTVHPNKTKAIIRLLEILEENPNYDPPCQEEKYDYLLFGLDMEREKLYNLINKRVDKMMDGGLVDEVKSLISLGTSRTSLGAIGYKEIIDYLDGKTSLDDAVLLIKQHSRNYAKRQLTYFRKMENINWVNYNDITLVKNKSLEFLNKGKVNG